MINKKGIKKLLEFQKSFREGNVEYRGDYDSKGVLIGYIAYKVTDNGCIACGVEMFDKVKSK